jgi:hypothetical protein
MRKAIMSIQELEAQLLTLDHSERLRLSQLLTQSLTAIPQSIPKPTVADAIAQFRNNMSPEELDPNAEDIWQDVRDRTPVASEPRW